MVSAEARAVDKTTAAPRAATFEYIFIIPPEYPHRAAF
jgi:hypothetical protein